MARSRRRKSRQVPRKQPRIVSRPAILPSQKDTATRTLLSGIDELADRLRIASDGGSTWQIKKGDARTIWVAHLKQNGAWDWTALHSAFTKVESVKAVYKDISDRRLCFLRLHYTQYDDDGREVGEGWFAPAPLTTWENLVKTVQEESDVDSRGSYAARYENTHTDTIVISFASRANV